MKLFRCDSCGNTLYFENVVCERCGHRLGYDPERNALYALEGDDQIWAPVNHADQQYVFCANAEHGACNWLVPFNPGGDPFCRACRHNELVPPFDQPDNLARWQTIERAKKRLIYSILRFRLPLATRNEDALHGLSFRFLAEADAPSPVMTGHDNGIITLALSEADDAAREYRRTQFHEPYRTLLGHFRHEIGHYYWDLLVANTPAHAEFRQIFGDESADYGAALQRHYDQGAPTGWQDSFISSYATAHPWEDFAETFAHFLHIVDTTEMASAYRVSLDPRVDVEGELTTEIDFNPYRLTTIGPLIDKWVPLSSLINNLNRAVGQHDAYPFVLTPAVIDKIAFVQRIVGDAGKVLWTVPGPDGAQIPINTPAG